MKRNILCTGLIAATTLLTLGSCYDLEDMNRDPYGVEDNGTGGEITPEEPTDTRYANINLNYRVSKEDSAAYKKQLLMLRLSSASSSTRATTTTIR